MTNFMSIKIENFLDFFLKVWKKFNYYCRLCSNTAYYFLVDEKFSKKKYLHTYIEYHIGDNLTHLCFLRGVALNNPDIFIRHYCKDEYLDAIKFYVADLQNICLLPLHKRPLNAINAWKNVNKFWEKHPKMNLFFTVYIDFFNYLSGQMKVENPIQNNHDFIFDSRLIGDKNRKMNMKYDWLIVNSKALSGQFQDDDGALDRLCIRLSKKYKIITTKKIYDIPCTLDDNLDLENIAVLSMFAKRHLMVCTGPCWLVLNDFTISNSEGIYIFNSYEKVVLDNKIKMFRSVEEFEIFLNNINGQHT